MDNQELLKRTEKWLVLMGIKGEPTHYTKNFLQWKKHKENLLKKGTVENLIYRFYDGKPNYKKLVEEVAYLVSLLKNYDPATITEKIMDKKTRGIISIVKPTKDEIENSYDDFGFVNLNPEISHTEYQKAFDTYCKDINKSFSSMKERNKMLEDLMKKTQHWELGMLDDFLYHKAKEIKKMAK